MDISAVGSASIEMSLAKVGQDVSIAMLKKAMDNFESSATQMVESMNQVVIGNTQLLNIMA